jgi:uncharacterized protein (TIGR02284 family)
MQRGARPPPLARYVHATDQPLEDVMAERTEREVLHHLVEVCRDGERGFRVAADYVEDPALKALFQELAEQRQQFARELVPHLNRLGGAPDWEGTVGGALHRGWMNVRAHVPGHADHAIVVEAARGEHAALGAYDEALHGMLPPTVSSLIEVQRDDIEESRARIRAFDRAA